MGISKIYTLVDMAGSEKRLSEYLKTTEKMLPKHVNSGAYMSVYINLMKQFLVDPKVTDKKSILNVLFAAPKTGLNPDPIMQQIFFIAYAGKLSYQVGYKGMIQLAYNAGMRVRAGLVFQKEKEAGLFNYYEDELGQHFRHEPILHQKDRGQEVCGYSVFTDVKDHFSQIHVMESFHIDDIKKMVLARMKTSSTPWKDPLFEPEMRKKTVIRRHAKTEPFSTEIARVIEHEERDERGEGSETIFDEIADIIGSEKEEQTHEDDDSMYPPKQQAEVLDLRGEQEELPY